MPTTDFPDAIWTYGREIGLAIHEIPPARFWLLCHDVPAQVRFHDAQVLGLTGCLDAEVA